MSGYWTRPDPKVSTAQREYRRAVQCARWVFIALAIANLLWYLTAG